VSEENVELARRGYTAFQALLERATAGADISDAPEWEVWDADVVIVEIADYPDAATYRGHEGMRRWLEGWLDAFDEMSFEPLEFIPAGDHVVVPTHQRFRSKAGLDVDQHITHVLRFRGGKVIYATGYRDKSSALAAVGLSE
jgi:ketosteroid isomerase-like protein